MSQIAYTRHLVAVAFCDYFFCHGTTQPISNECTAQEQQIYERTRRELENETNAEVWEQKNDALRRLVLLTIPNPNE